MEHVPFYKVSQISLFLGNLLFLTSFLLFLSKLVLKEIHEYGILSLHIYNQIVKNLKRVLLLILSDSIACTRKCFFIDLSPFVSPKFSVASYWHII